MKISRVATFALLGMVFTGVSVYSVTPAGGFSIAAEASPASDVAIAESEPLAPFSSSGAELAMGTTLRVLGRVGHKTLAQGDKGETYLLLEVSGSEQAGKARPPVNLSLVIDRSGSMKGSRLRNAISAALTAVDRLGDGDVVSVVAFDNKSEVLVPPTTLDPASRFRIRSGIQGITLGGDTCISCGIEEGLAQLERTPDRVHRMIVLSDGEATAGVRDLPGFRSIAQRAAARGASITTIGVDVDYNERVLSAIALDSNGRHHFVANDGDLAAAFEAEARSLTEVVASNAEATLELPAGVELVRVVDRSFRRSGNRLSFSLGSLTAGETQTILVQLRVPTQTVGSLAVANIDVTFRDHTKDQDGRAQGTLSTDISQAGTSDLDPFVSARIQRTRTADALKEASELFKQGRTADAQKRLAEHGRALAAAAAKVPADSGRTASDFKAQEAALARAQGGFAAPPSPDPFAAPAHQSRKGKEAVKTEAEDELQMRR